MSGSDSGKTVPTHEILGAEATSDTKPQSQDSRDEIDQEILKLLVCPFTKKPLVYDAKRSELVSETARLAFPVRQGVPLMTRDAARHLDDPAPSNSDDEA